MSGIGIPSLKSGGNRHMPEIKEKDSPDESIEMVMKDFRNKEGKMKGSLSNKHIIKRSFG